MTTFSAYTITEIIEKHSGLRVRWNRDAQRPIWAAMDIAKILSLPELPPTDVELLVGWEKIIPGLTLPQLLALLENHPSSISKALLL